MPHGANNLPKGVAAYFKQFEKVYLWMDADQAGRNASNTFAKALGEDRVYVVNTRLNDPEGPKDANECLLKGLNLANYLKTAKKLAGDNIITLKDIKSDIVQFLSQYEVSTGYKSQSFSFFNKKVKGLRTGELTVLSGETGSGKTTFLTQLSLDFLKQGVPTLWGSFEIKNDKIGSIFMIQNARRDLRRASADEIRRCADEIEKYPLYLMNFHGSSSITEVMNSIEYSISQYGIKNIVLDNLQFMVGTQAKSMNKFDFQDQIIQTLRRIATDQDVHVTLVIHPKKTEEALTISSIFGSAKATQEADNVFMLTNYKGLRIIEVAKNRFDGACGKAVLAFDKTTNRFFELSESEFKEYVEKDWSVNDLVQSRIDKHGRVELNSEPAETKVDESVMKELEREIYSNEENIMEDQFTPENKDIILEEEISNHIPLKEEQIEAKEEEPEQFITQQENIEIPPIKQDKPLLNKEPTTRQTVDNHVKWNQKEDFNEIEANLSSIFPSVKQIETFHSNSSFEKAQNIATYMFYKSDQKKKKASEIYSGLDFL